MKRIGRVLSLITILVLMTASSVFAFTIESTYPGDGATKVSLENMGIKVTTNGTFTASVLGESNDNAVQIYGPDGSEVPTKIFYSEKEPNMILITTGDVIKEDKKGNPVSSVFTAESDSDYKLVISGSLKDDKGTTLGSDLTINLHTVNQKRNNTVNTLLMFVMMGAMLLITTKAAKKKEEKETPVKKDVNTVNPYKEAKKTGKSVQEIVEKDKADKQKQAEKEARQAEKEAKKKAQEAEEDFLEEGHYRVAGRKSALNAGSVYAQKKREERLAKEAQQAKWDAQKKKKGKK